MGAGTRRAARGCSRHSVGHAALAGNAVPAGTGHLRLFLWAGEDFGDEDDFFEPMHVRHLPEWVPEVVPYLALLPGWRFLVAPGHEDVWFDERLVDPSQYE